MSCQSESTSWSQENEYFGTTVGSLDIYQLSHAKYYERCKLINSDELDSTG